MPETEYIWKFPGAISDWLGTGLQDMVILKRIEGTSPYTRIQERFKEESHSDINLISVRKKIKGYEKIRLINIEPRLVVTEFGNQFVNAPNEDEKRIVLRKSLLSIHFWNPIEENMSGSFDIDPYKAVLYMLLKLGHLTKLEAGNIVVLIRNQDDVERGVNQILQKRNSGQQFPMWLNPDGSENMDITNPVTHMFSLYSCTDYIRKNSSGNLILRGDKIDDNLKQAIKSDINWYWKNKKKIKTLAPSIFDEVIVDERVNRLSRMLDGETFKWDWGVGDLVKYEDKFKRVKEIRENNDLVFDDETSNANIPSWKLKRIF